jgi:hypothetical protein
MVDKVERLVVDGLEEPRTHLGRCEGANKGSVEKNQKGGRKGCCIYA